MYDTYSRFEERMMQDKTAIEQMRLIQQLEDDDKQIHAAIGRVVFASWAQ